MADAVTSQTIVDGERNCVMKFTNVSDGTGESAVAKVDVSALGTDNAGRSCSEVRILRVSHAIVGIPVLRQSEALVLGVHPLGCVLALLCYF